MTRTGWRNRLGLVAALALLAGIGTPVLAQENPANSFLKAVKERDGTKVQDALDKPGNTMLSARGDDGDSALHIVAKRGDITWLRFLLAKGAPMDIRDRDGNTPMMDAVRIGFDDGVQQLIDVGAQVDLANNRGETPLIVATQRHDLVAVRALVAGGADPRITDHVAGMSAIDYAKRDGRSVVILKLLQDVQPKVKKQVAGPQLN